MATASGTVRVSDLGPGRPNLREAELDAIEGWVPPRWRRSAGISQVSAPLLGPFAPSPPLAANFLALLDDGSGVAPPDTMGAAGPNHLFVTLNTQIRIQTKTGTTLSTSRLDLFYSTLLVTNDFVFDPHVLYDPDANRWILVALVINQNGLTITNGDVLLAVSRTSDPTGQWNLFRVECDGNANMVCDYPLVGFNRDWIVVSTNRFNLSLSGGTFVGARTFVLDKAAAYANTGNGAHTTFSLSGSPPNDDFALSPATTLDPSSSTLYMLEDYDGTMRNLRLFSITGAVGAETMTRLADVVPASLSVWDDAPPASSNGNFAPQAGSSVKIEVNDARINSVVYRNGALWATHTVFLPSGAATHSAAQWMAINPATSAVLQAGRIEDPTATQTVGFHYIYPSLSVNRSNDVFMGFTRTSPTTFASAAFSMRFSWDAASTMRDATVYKAGTASYNVTSAFNPSNRWGDYSATVVDPVDDQTMWTIQEYVNTANRFGTWWGKLTVDCVGKANGSECNDNDLCSTAPKTCQNGVCAGSSSVVCTASDQCHVAGTCNPATGLCSNPAAADGTPCNDNTLCTTSDQCTGGVCGGTAVVCTPSDQCHVAGTCSPATGCSNPAASDGTSCNDGSLCTLSDQCTGGICGGTAVVCTASDQCHVAGTCNSATGQCSNPAASDGTQCNDGSLCTTSDQCTGGVCGGTAVVCTASDQCHVAGTCNPANGQCSNPAASDGTPCNDGSLCTTNDQCASGACGGMAVVCTASDQCHVAGTCNPSTGQCSNPPAADGTACTGGSCMSGVCVPPPDAGVDAPSADAAADAMTAVDGTTTADAPPLVDAPTTIPDARPADAPTLSDAGTSPRPEAGAGGAGESGGCGCRVGGESSDPPQLWIPGLMAAIVWRRRRAKR